VIVSHATSLEVLPVYALEFSTLIETGLDSSVRLEMKLNATVTYRLPAVTAVI
jgi:hypothetical protein